MIINDTITLALRNTVNSDDTTGCNARWRPHRLPQMCMAAAEGGGHRQARARDRAVHPKSANPHAPCVLNAWGAALELPSILCRLHKVYL